MAARVAYIANCYALLINKRWFGLAFLEVNFAADKYWLDCDLECSETAVWISLPLVGRPVLNPTGSDIQTAVSEHFLTDNHSASPMLLIPTEKLNNEGDSL